MVRKILNWSDKQMEDAYNANNAYAKRMGKAALSGLAEGVVNGAFVVGVIELSLDAMKYILKVK